MALESHAATIFVIDDDQGLLRLMQKVLRREGFNVATANSGTAALAWLSQNAADLALLDLKLQDVEASEMVRRLTGSQRPTPFVIITGQGDERVAVEMMKRGALDYLVKDVDFLQFLPQVTKRALDRLHKDRRLVQLQKQILEISEREQRRIGQDLHDGLGQQLTAIELMCEALKSNSKAAADPRQLGKELDRLSQYIRSAIAQTRSLARGLIPFNVESGGLEMALTELARSSVVANRVDCLFHSDSTAPLDDYEATHLYRIAQEAVNNALKHSSATRIEIDLSAKAGMLCLRISDNGKGLPTAAKEGLGLDVMNHRAGVIGAELLIKTTPGKGVSITCLLPRAGEVPTASRGPKGLESPGLQGTRPSAEAKAR
jgi:signal transduction histidine kinase